MILNTGGGVGGRCQQRVDIVVHVHEISVTVEKGRIIGHELI